MARRKMTRRDQLINAYIKSMRDSLERKSNRDLATRVADHLHCSYCPLEGKCDDGKKTCYESFEAWLNEEVSND